MRKNLTVRNWIKKKFGKDIPSKCNEAFKDNSLAALPISFRNSDLPKLYPNHQYLLRSMTVKEPSYWLMKSERV